MMLDLTPDLVRRPKRLRLGGLLPTLPDRVTHARQGKLSHVEFLELLLQDEIDRRDSHGLTLRLEQAAFEETATFEQIVWDSPVSFDRARVRELFNLPRLRPRAQCLPRRPPRPLRRRHQTPAGAPSVPGR